MLVCALRSISNLLLFAALFAIKLFIASAEIELTSDCFNVTNALHCDGIYDCVERMDEFNCRLQANYCLKNQFACKDGGGCVPKRFLW